VDGMEETVGLKDNLDGRLVKKRRERRNEEMGI